MFSLHFKYKEKYFLLHVGTYSLQHKASRSGYLGIGLTTLTLITIYISMMPLAKQFIRAAILFDTQASYTKCPRNVFVGIGSSLFSDWP